MQKNEIYEIEITGMTDQGEGVGKADGMAVFVPYTILGEKVRILIVKVLKSYAYGKLLEVITPSIHRLRAECPHFYQCGGCQLWHMDTEAELEYKRQMVKDCLTRIGGLSIIPEPVADSGNFCRYRNKAQYPVTPDGIGFYRKNSHDVIPLDDCIIQSETDSKILSVIKEWMGRYNIAPYNEENHSGTLRHIYLRQGKYETLLVLVTATEELPKKDELISSLLNLGLPISGIVQNINPKKTNVVLGNKNIVLWGKDYLIDNIGDVRFKISPHSFYQVNRFTTKKLYDIAGEMSNLTGKETLWDIYCGIGTIGQYLSKGAKKLIGIEIIPEAVENARENAELNKISNAEYHCGKAEDILPKLASEGNKNDVVILDPPRKGCDSVLLDTVLKMQPKKIVYISCKPSTLARDLKILTNGGYELMRVVPVNMFPKSSHIESVAQLIRKSR